MKQRIIITCLLLLYTTQAPGQPDPIKITALTNVTVIDGTGGNPLEEMTVLIEGKFISDIFKTDSKPLPTGAEIMDFKGNYLLPGLINSHIHLSHILLGRTTNNAFENQQDLLHAELKRMLYGGVTSIRDMAGDTRLLAMVKRSLYLNEIIGLDLYYSALLAAPDFINNDPRVAGSAKGFKLGEPAWQQIITHESDVNLVVARASGTHATGLKFDIGIESDVMRELTEEAHRQELKVWAHSTVFPGRPIDVVRAGVDAISHICFIPWQDEDLQPSENIPYTDTPREDARPRFNSELVQADSPEMKELYTEMVRRNTLFDITLSAYSNGSWSALGCTPQLMTEIARASSGAGVSITTGTDYFMI